MAKQKIMTIYERKRELKDLVEDAEKMGFASHLIKKYKGQLSEIEATLKKESDRRARIKELGQVELRMERSQDKGEVMDLTGRREVLLDGINNNVMKGGLKNE